MSGAPRAARLPVPPDAVSPAAGELLAAVPRETRARLDLYVRELRRWQNIRNLVARSTLDQIWDRHIADSLQIANLGPDGVWADLGSGAGFPGLVTAIVRPAVTVHLVESDSRKCAFLRHVIRETRAGARVWEGRVETVLAALDPAPAVVTARALADLSTLLGFSEQVLMTGAIGLFPKGRSYAAELTRAGEHWRFDADVIPSRLDPAARILRIRNFEGRRIQPSLESP